MVGKYRLQKPLLAIFPTTRLGRAIPAETVVEIPQASASRDPMVEIVWEGKPMLMFVRDLKCHGEEVR